MQVGSGNCGTPGNPDVPDLCFVSNRSCLSQEPRSVFPYPPAFTDIFEINLSRVHYLTRSHQSGPASFHFHTKLLALSLHSQGNPVEAVTFSKALAWSSTVLRVSQRTMYFRVSVLLVWYSVSKSLYSRLASCGNTSTKG
jgi:hypothetical protein